MITIYAHIIIIVLMEIIKEGLLFYLVILVIPEIYASMKKEK